jgi:hypothetical protein
MIDLLLKWLWHEVTHTTYSLYEGSSLEDRGGPGVRKRGGGIE